jgi:hypothetical protein
MYITRFIDAPARMFAIGICALSLCLVSPAQTAPSGAGAGESTLGKEVLNNDAVLKMARAGLAEDVIVSAIEQHPGKYLLEPDDLISLKNAGLGDRIIAAMQHRNAAPAVTAIAPTAPKPLVLQDGAPIRLRLNRTLSSADEHAGNGVDFEVLDEVKVGDVLVVLKGGMAVGTVTEAQPKRRMARGGKLNVNIDYVRVITGDKVALRAVKESKGGGHVGAMTGAMVATGIVFLPAAPFFLFMHGKDITIPKGTEITAYVNGNATIAGAKVNAPVAVTPAPPAQPPADTPQQPNPPPAQTSADAPQQPDPSVAQPSAEQPPQANPAPPPAAAADHS